VPEALHRRLIGYTFAVSTTHVTLEQFMRFDPNFVGRKQLFRCPKPDCPILEVTWYEATAYCNWLSKQEDLPENQWCYVPNQNGRFEEGMQLAPDYLRRTGYRLPTEAEWEYACRAGSVTRRFYGESDELLEKYAWYSKNSEDRTWPVGTLKPNDLGLFDMHGNLWVWCQEKPLDYLLFEGGKMVDETEEDPVIHDRVDRVLRGGAFYTQAGDVRSANRFTVVLSYANITSGFRLARSFR